MKERMKKLKELVTKSKKNLVITIGCTLLVICMVGGSIIYATQPAEQTVAAENVQKDEDNFTKTDISDVVAGIEDHYILQNAKNIDYNHGVTYDKSIVKDVEVNSDKVDLSKPGEYKVTYTVKADKKALEEYLTEKATAVNTTGENSAADTTEAEQANTTGDADEAGTTTSQDAEVSGTDTSADQTGTNVSATEKKEETKADSSAASKDQTVESKKDIDKKQDSVKDDQKSEAKKDTSKKEDKKTDSKKEEISKKDDQKSDKKQEETKKEDSKQDTSKKETDQKDQTDSEKSEVKDDQKSEEKSDAQKPEEKKDTSSSDKKDETVDIKIDTTITVVDKDRADEIANKGDVVWKDNNETVPKTDGTTVAETPEVPASTETTGGTTADSGTQKEPAKNDQKTEATKTETPKQDSKPNTSSNQGSQTSAPSQSTQPPKQTHTHNYNIPITKVVHHDATGHNEPVYKTVTDYQDQPVYATKCVFSDGFMCDTAHEAIIHSSETGLGYSVKDVQVGTQRVAVGSHQEQTSTRWVQDRAAYDETVTVGYKCSCGAQR